MVRLVYLNDSTFLESKSSSSQSQKKKPFLTTSVYMLFPPTINTISIYIYIYFLKTARECVRDILLDTFVVVILL